MLGRKRMKNWIVEFSVGLPDNFESDRYADHIESVLETLDDLDGIADADATLSAGERVLRLHMCAEGADCFDVLGRSLTALRTAIHTVGGSTPGWEKMLAEMMDRGSLAARREDVAA